MDLRTADELAYLPIGTVWKAGSSSQGDLFTNGDLGLRKWNVQVDQNQKSFRIGPPDQPIFAASGAGNYSMDQSETVIASARFTHCDVATAQGGFSIGPLDDCRGCSVSPDGKWLAAGSHLRGGSIWEIASRKKIRDLARDDPRAVVFSPDGRFLLVEETSCLKMLKVGTWEQANELPAKRFLAFSPDGNFMACLDSTWVVHLMDSGGSRTYARLTTPDPTRIQNHRASFSPDGKKLVVTTNDPPSLNVWDLEAFVKNSPSSGSSPISLCMPKARRRRQTIG